MPDYRVSYKTGEQVELPPHGTYARYWQEVNGVPGETCRACKAAAAAYRRRRNNKCARGLGWPLRQG
jgi:hypothetical protein